MSENSKKYPLLEAINIGSVVVIKASKKLADEISEELLIEDPETAGEIISKNKVVVNE